MSPQVRLLQPQPRQQGRKEGEEEEMKELRKIPTHPRSAVRDLEPVVNSYPNRNK